MFHVPLERRRHGDEPQRLGRRGAIQHDHVVGVLLPVLIHVHQRAQFFHARQDGQLLGFHVSQPGGAQHRRQIAGNLAPMALELDLNIDFLDVQVFAHLAGIGGGRVEQPGLQGECVRQAVRRVHAHHKRLEARSGQLHPRGGRDARFADPPLAAIQQNAHYPWSSRHASAA